MAVHLQRTSTHGVMSGRGAGVRGQAACRVEFLHRDAVLKAGDQVVTSGLGGVFPKGLLVG